MIPDFTIVTAVTPEYKNHLYWSMSTWAFKPQLKDRQLIVFYNGMKEKDLMFVRSIFSEVRLIEWNMDNVETKQELMFSAFVFGAIQYVKTPYYIKLDADAYCTNAADIWNESDFQYDIIGHKWGYTKPGWYIDAIENYYSKSNILINKEEQRRAHKRFESYCCLHRTEWVKCVSQKLNGRLPVPSHDTTLWFYADKEGHWGSKNIKKCGVGNNSRWKNIREVVCSGDMAFSSMVNEVLLSHIQLEITSRCNIGCYQCDRNCGLIDPGPDMKINQVWKFVEWSLDKKHKWNRIDIIGGEPTLHKDLKTIFEMVKIYKNRYPRCKIRFSTNGHGAEEVVSNIPEWVHIRNSEKNGKAQQHTAYRCSPVDLGETVIKSCSVPWRCGLGFTRYGIFPCGAGASLARVFGFDIGIKNFNDINAANIKKQMLTLCKYCGHSGSVRKIADGNEMTDSWKNAVKNYSIEKMSVI